MPWCCHTVFLLGLPVKIHVSSTKTTVAQLFRSANVEPMKDKAKNPVFCWRISVTSNRSFLTRLDWIILLNVPKEVYSSQFVAARPKKPQKVNQWRFKSKPTRPKKTPFPEKKNSSRGRWKEGCTWKPWMARRLSRHSHPGSQAQIDSLVQHLTSEARDGVHPKWGGTVFLENKKEPHLVTRKTKDLKKNMNTFFNDLRNNNSQSYTVPLLK